MHTSIEVDAYFFSESFNPHDGYEDRLTRVLTKRIDHHAYKFFGFASKSVPRFEHLSFDV
jgi:hypothetical protein